MEPDCIRLNGLAIVTLIGVPEEERAMPQHLRVNLTLFPRNSITGLGDQVAGTIDYAAVATAVRQLAWERPRQLIETLAEEITDLLLATFPVQTVVTEVVKFILPDTTSVAVQITKTASGPA